MRTDSGSVVFGGSLAAREGEKSAGGDKAPAAAAFWSGASGSSKATPSLLPAATDPELSPGSRPELVVAMGMLGFGLAAMLAGFLVATHRRRRRVPVEVEPRTGVAPAASPEAPGAGSV